MKKHNVLRSLQSFALFPIFAANLMAAPLALNKLPPAAVLSTPENSPLLAVASDNQQAVHDQEVAKINGYLGSIGSPITGSGEEFVKEAELNNIPWNLEVSIAMAESTEYKHPCRDDQFNGFGWNSCVGVKFTSVNEAIDTIATSLGGNDPDTAKYYAGKSVEDILKMYNPPIVAPKYINHVKEVMQAISDFPVNTPADPSATTA